MAKNEEGTMVIQQVMIQWEKGYLTATIDAIQVFQTALNGRPAAEVVAQAEDAVAALIHKKVLAALSAEGSR